MELPGPRVDSSLPLVVLGNWHVLHVCLRRSHPSLMFVDGVSLSVSLSLSHTHTQLKEKVIITKHSRHLPLNNVPEDQVKKQIQPVATF